MKNYEVTFIVDPVLSGDEIKQAAQTYQDMLEQEQCKIVHVERMGLRQLAYPINRRSSGVYFCIEFETETGNFIPKMDLSFRRDERIMRFLTIKLDKYGVKYNDDKRKGLIGKKRTEEETVVPVVAKAPPVKAEKKPPVKEETASVTTPIAKSEEE
ncbi:MAG: 30S ribosomal protein S6 [Saprospiraceae bacterium]